MILSRNKWLGSKHYKVLSKCWEVSRPQCPQNVNLPHLLSYGSSFTKGRGNDCVCPCATVVLFSFVLSYRAPDVQSLLLSGEQTQKLKGRASQCWRSWGTGNCLHKTPPKGGSQSPPSIPLNHTQKSETPLSFSGSASGKVGLVAEGRLRSLPRLAALVSPISVLCQPSCQMKETVWFSRPRNISGMEPRPWPCHHSPSHLLSCAHSGYFHLKCGKKEN